MKKTKVIAGFSGIGKSLFKKIKNDKDITCFDSDSSKFSWNYNADGTRERNPNFIKEYIRHINIIKESNTVDYIFVSTHEEVRKELIKQGLLDILVFPSLERKKEYLENFKKHRIDKQINIKEKEIQKNIYNLIDANYENWIKECQSEKNITKIELSEGNYLIDIL